MNKNQDIIDYLDNYIDKENKYDFAVLINGEWGCGKTHFINEYKNKITQGENKFLVLYVSLNGIKDIKQIENKFFEQLNPFWANEKVKFFGSIISTGSEVFKAFTQFDTAAEAEKYKHYFTDVSKKLEGNSLIIFDDLERCKIQLSEILGFVNNLVEHQKLRVLLLAYEEEIDNIENENDAAEKKAYRRIKEKLIGQTLTITPEIEAALIEFLNTIKSDNAKKLFKDEFENIVKLFKASEKNNIRILKQVLWEFERLSNLFSDELWLKRKDINEFLLNYLIISIETKLGTLKQGEISSFDSYIFLGNSDGEFAKRIKKINDKYNTDFASIKVSKYELNEFVFGGNKCGELVKSLEENICKVDLPIWRRLWRWFELEELEGKELLEKFSVQFNNYEFKELGEILHVFGIMLSLSKNEITKHSMSEVVDNCKNYINEITKKENFSSYLNYGKSCISEYESEYGYGFSSIREPKFIELKNYFWDKIRENSLPFLQIEANKVLANLKSGNNTIIADIASDFKERSKFLDTPFLQYIDATEFAKAFVEADAQSQISVGRALSIRFNGGRKLKTELSDEKEWFKELTEQSKLLSAKMDSFTKSRIKSLLSQYFDASISVAEIELV